MRAGDSRLSTTAAIAAIAARREEDFRCLDRNGIRASALDRFESFLTAPDTLSQPSLVIRCQIADGDWTIRTVVDKSISRWRLTEAFAPLTPRLTPRRRRADFFVLISDTLHVAAHRKQECIEHFTSVPFLRCDRSEDDPLTMHAIMIPDFFVLHRQYADELAAIERAVHEHPFEQRLDVLKWRGGFHGPHYANDDNYRSFPRYWLVLTSRAHPEIVDARLTNHRVEPSESGVALRQRLEREFGAPATVIPVEAFVAYKYLISTDGVGAAWKRLPTILASGSVLLMQHRWQQFFYAGLQPWVHYVPVKDDMSDLVERYHWLRTHGAHARAIAENGLDFARRILTPRALEASLREVIQRCADLYRPDA
jgi:hypothetical protein